MNIRKTIFALAAALWFGGGVIPTVAFADTEKTQAWSIAYGGRLYDDWTKALYRWYMKDAGTHPAYPAEGKQKGVDTWRCKECHGWDYKGRDGAYSKGSHFTGIKGLRDAVGMPVEQIARVIRDQRHGYSELMLPNEAVEALALFVSKGQVDVEPVIDRATKMAKGDAKRGARFFQTICATCHGFDGRQINFRTRTDPQFLGTVASDNPWEALHKIRSGQPGAPMPSLGALDVQDLLDVLAYAQTLPKK
jgi:mono/diheme cytochrome c family protein